MATDQSGLSVSVRVLGEIRIDYDGVAVGLPDSIRAVALLGWLAIHPGLRSRSEIASALWPDVHDSSARSSVRTALWALRRAFSDHADEVLDTSRNRIGLRNVSVDVTRFDELVAEDRLEEALAISAGELLAGLDDEWAVLARESHRDKVIALLRDQSDKAATNGDPALAIERARLAAELNPQSETCARLLMRRYDEAGDCSLALAVYTRIVDRLRNELKIAPADETWQLAEKIRGRQQDQRRKIQAPRVLRRLALTPLVGRDAELHSLGRAWRSARRGEGGVAVVCGEPGLGKTRLVAELTELAANTGGLTALGAAPTIGCPPYWPWAELAAGLLRSLGGVPLGEPFTTALAPLLPTMIQPTAPGPPDFEQARLMEGLLDLLAYAAAQAPLLAVLEDMHGCDEASAMVLARACRRVQTLPVLLVWTRRPRPVPAALADAEEQARHCAALVADVALEPLRQQEIAEIARNAGVIDDDAIGTVVASADGNALLAVEASRAIARGDADIAEGLRSTVRASRRHLSARARALCEVMAVAGRPLSVEDARRRAGSPDDGEFDAAFEAAGDAGLLQIVDAAIDFRHALVRDAYYADLPELQRMRLHAAAAHDIDENGEPELAGEAARHLLAAGDRDGGAGLLVRAANHAMSLGALSRADELLGEAAALQPSNVEIVLELAGVAAHRGMADQAQGRFDRAVTALDAAGDRLGVVTTYIRWAEWNTGPLCRPLVARQAVITALEMIDTAGVSALRLRLQAQAFLALCEAMAGDPAACEEILDSIDTQCGRLPTDPIRDIRRHIARTLAHIRHGRFDEVGDAGRAAAAIARSVGRLDLMYGSLLNAAAGLASTGAYAEALELLDEIGTMPSAGALPLAIEADVQLSRAWLMSRLGRHPEAMRVASSTQRLAERIGGTELAATADAETGRILLRARHYEDAAECLGRALSAETTSIGRPLARLQRAEALTRLVRLTDAQQELTATALEPVGPADWPDTLVARMASVRGLIAAAQGNRVEAERYLQRAAAGWRRRIVTADATGSTSALADLGRPVIGQVSPTEELEAVLADLAQLNTRSTHAKL
ncbi:MAG: transcriptional activator domain [Mycobacterium sp.]|jgi:DNA-binding SARP family transcriptional activator/tetratricopeptide (TPR) repeat protein|uniref:ATP-binding protein n=1 Tax=Mycobacterium sp. TaxID=1785 RepID=UPI0026061E9F|nr:AAA family ATPase [Mycobacterium sp.]MCW2660187.1 transcriptional activator domain [Mycobacterium sp.]